MNSLVRAMQADAALDARRGQQDDILGDLRARMARESKKAIYRGGAKDALVELQEAILTEEMRGMGRRLSDPKNAEGRNAFYVDEMAKRVNRQVEGDRDLREYKMTDELVSNFKAQRQLR